jgi:hypothetical protein
MASVWDDFLRLVSGKKAPAPTDGAAPIAQGAGAGALKTLTAMPQMEQMELMPEAPTPPAPAYDANTDPNKIAAGKTELQKLLQQLNGAYDNIFTDVDTLAKDKRATVDKTFDQSDQDLMDNYGKTSDATREIYSARNIYNSNYRTQAEDDNTKTFNRGLTDNQTGRQNAYGGIGSWIDTTKADVNAKRPDIDLNRYQDYNSVIGAQDTTKAAIKSAQASRAGLKTNSSYINDLNAVAPKTTDAGSVLTQQLSSLVNNAAPLNAKMEIAKGYISRAGLDSQEAKDYWMNYFMGLNSPGQKPAIGAPQKPIV